MKAIILAAGRGSRLREKTDDRPKCLVEVAGIPLLERQLTALRGAGITEIAVVTGYKRELLESKGLKSFNNPRWAETNMVMSLTSAAEWLRAGPCLVSYSDIFYGSHAPAALMANDGDIAVTYDPNWLSLWQARFPDPLADAETFRCDAHGRLLEIGERASSVDQIRGQYMGLLRFTPKGWDAVERALADLPAATRDKLDVTSLLRNLLARQQPIAAVAAPGAWGEVDSGEDLALYENNPAQFGL